MRRTHSPLLKLLTLTAICLGAASASRAADHGRTQGAASSRNEKQSTRLVTIASPAEGESLTTAPVKLLVNLERGANPWAFRARLNGQDITRLFAPAGRPAPGQYQIEAAVLPQDGLRRERNELVVEAAGRGFAQGRDSRAFFITGPQAEAGADLQVKVGRSVQLDGGGAVGAQPLTHRWSIVRQPEGSAATLADADTPRPSFVPDVPGTYVVQLVVNDGHFDSAADTVSVSAAPARGMVTINTRVVSNQGVDATDYGIHVGDTTYTPAGLDCPDLPLIGVQVLTLDRKTTEKLDYKCFATIPDASGFENYINTRTSDQLVIVSGLRSVFGKLDASPLGGANYRLDEYHAYSYSLIGVKGLGVGQAYENVIGDGSLQGYMVQDTQGNYTFMPQDYVTFKVTSNDSSVTPSNSTIKISDKLYEAPPLPSGAAGGFWVLKLSRSDLSEASSKTFGTNNPDPNAGQTEMESMATELGYNTTPPVDQFLFIVTTVGAPLNTFPGGQHIHNLANALEALGGTGYTLQGLYDNRDKTPNYTLVGAVNPSDSRLPRPQRFTSSSLYTDQGETGVVSGVLGRNRLNLFEPVAWADESGDSSDNGMNYEFYQVAWQPPVAWPVPTNAGQQAAYKYISQKLTAAAFGCQGNANCNDLRSYYTSTVDDPCQLKDSMSPATVSYPGDGNGFSSGDFAAVYNQLDGNPNNADARHELTYACNVHNFYNSATELFTAQNSNVGLILDGVAGEIQKDLQQPSVAVKDISVLKIMATVARTTGMAIPDPASKVALGVMSGVINVAASHASASASGVPTGEFTTKVATLQTDAAGYFAQVQAGVGLTFGNILTDWGKLSSVGQKVGNEEAGWDWDTTTNGHLLAAFNLATRRHYFEQLLPTAYSLDYMWKVERSDPKQVGTTGKGFPVVCYTYYSNRPDASWNGYRTIDVPTVYDLLIITRTQRNHGAPIFPSDTLLNTLFGSPNADGTGGLGLVKDTFFSINGPLYPWRPEAEASSIRCYPK